MESNYNEKELLDQVSRGEEKSFGELFHYHKHRIYTIAWHYTESVVLSEEIVQDVFLRVWKNREKLGEIQDFTSWIYTIAKNRSLSSLEKIARDEKRDYRQLSYLPAGTNDAELRISEKEVQELLRGAIQLLSPQQRKVFQLCRLEGIPREKVAEQLGLSPATVSVHLTIALRTVRAFLTSHLNIVCFLLMKHYL